MKNKKIYKKLSFLKIKKINKILKTKKNNFSYLIQFIILNS
jgi:hypothetical protein